MDTIRPVSDLRNKFVDISRDVHATGRPVFLTKNGRGDMVVMSMEAYERLDFQSEVFAKLLEAERSDASHAPRHSLDEGLSAMRDAIDAEHAS